MSKWQIYSLNALAFAPTTGFIVTSLYWAQVYGEAFTHWLWFATGLLALQSNADKIKHISQGVARFYIGAIVVNLVTLCAPLVDLQLNMWVKALMSIVLALAFILAMLSLYQNLKKAKLEQTAN